MHLLIYDIRMSTCAYYRLYNMKIPALICLLVLTGCYYQDLKTAEVDPSASQRGVEAYSWSPPTEDELQLRRFRQQEIDELTAEMERQIFVNEDMALVLDELQASIRQYDADISKLEADGAKRIAAMKERVKKLEMSEAQLEKSKRAIEKGIKKVKQDRANRVLSEKQYAAAIQFFKDGNYDSSIASFKKALSLNPPGSLIDKMHFGIGSSYYKMKKYKKAVNDLDVIVSRNPKSSKWFISSAMLGWLYNNLGEKSKALYVLENAVQKKPPEAVLSLLNRIIQLVQEEASDTKEMTDTQAPKKATE